MKLRNHLRRSLLVPTLIACAWIASIAESSAASVIIADPSQPVRTHFTGCDIQSSYFGAHQVPHLTAGPCSYIYTVPSQPGNKPSTMFTQLRHVTLTADDGTSTLCNGCYVTSVTIIEGEVVIVLSR